jgi:hypothetical protein
MTSEECPLAQMASRTSTGSRADRATIGSNADNRRARDAGVDHGGDVLLVRNREEHPDRDLVTVHMQEHIDLDVGDVGSLKDEVRELGLTMRLDREDEVRPAQGACRRTLSWSGDLTGRPEVDDCRLE